MTKACITGTKDNLSEFRKHLYDAALYAGMPIISGDKCCQLLAWLFVYGGSNEQVVIDNKLGSAMLYAQKRLNLQGGEVPDAELTPALQNYIKSIQDFDSPPEWIFDLENEYGIKPVYRRKKK